MKTGKIRVLSTYAVIDYAQNVFPYIIEKDSEVITLTFLP